MRVRDVTEQIQRVVGLLVVSIGKNAKKAIEKYKVLRGCAGATGGIRILVCNPAIILLFFTLF